MGLTQKRLKELLRYEPETGHFYWSVVATPNQVKPGRRAGAVRRSGKNAGRIEIMISGQSFCAHRLAFLYMTGKWPAEQVDHIDGNCGNNRWRNLREANGFQNMQNIWKPRVTNKVGALGVHQNKWGHFRAQILVGGKRRFIGSFRSKDEAYAAYLAAKAELHPFGEIARDTAHGKR